MMAMKGDEEATNNSTKSYVKTVCDRRKGDEKAMSLRERERVV